MRKIEKQICESFDSMKNKRVDCKRKLSSRDYVEHDCFTTDYYLHEELVVWYFPAKYQFRFSLRGYNTLTTRSRLRAFLRYFCLAQQLYMKKGKLYLETFDGVHHEVDPNGIYTINFNNELKGV